MLQGFSGEGRRKQRGKKGKKEAGREEGLGSWEGRRKLEGNKEAGREEGSSKGRRKLEGKKESGRPGEEGSWDGRRKREGRRGKPLYVDTNSY